MLPHWVNRYVGTRFVWGGRDLDGVDCYGLVALVYQEVRQITLPDVPYDIPPCQHAAVSAYTQAINHPGWKPVQTPQEFDVVILRLAGLPLHCGIMVNSLQFIHAIESGGVLIESLGGPVWRDRIGGGFRWAL